MYLFVGILDNFKAAQSAIAPKIDPDADLGKFLTGGSFNIFALIFFFMGCIFFFNLILAAWDYLLSQGDSKKIAAATSRIVNSFIGIIVVLASFLIIRVVSAMIGLQNQF